MLVFVDKNIIPQILRFFYKIFKTSLPLGRNIPYKKKANKLSKNVWKSSVV